MMCLINPFQKFLSLPIVDAADFDGTNDYMLRGAGLTGAADSKTGIFSAWVRIDGGDGNTRKIFESTAAKFKVDLTTNNFVVSCSDTVGNVRLNGGSNSTYLASSTWLHILSSWDAAAASFDFYVSDVSDRYLGSLADVVFDYTQTDWAIGSSVAGVDKFNGCLAEIYFAPGQYLDFSIETNRRKFISSSGKPQHLGTDGSLPTGTAPLVYLHLDDGEAVANFATNRGTGGNFSITGTLATASTSPSD